MKCPKCGYNSFEFNDACKKCAQDLTSYKASHGLKPIVLPQETRIALAASLKVEPEQVPVPQQTTESSSDMFSFDLPDDSPPSGSESIDTDNVFKSSGPPVAAPLTGYGTFSFDEEPGINQTQKVDDAFSDLLESSPLASSDGFAGQSAVPGEGTPAEYELSSFSWDEPDEKSTAEGKKPDDDFESLFGGIDSVTKK